MVSPNIFIVNIWQTKNTPWIIKYFDFANTIDDMQEADYDYDNISKLRDLIAQLKVFRISLPTHFSELSLPRYYLIAVNNETVTNIVGIRRNLIPTKWGYHFGYWHPIIQVALEKALDKALEKATQITQAK